MIKLIAQAAAPAASSASPTTSAAGSASAAPASAFSSYGVVIWLLFLGALYFLMIAPQKKKQKEHEKLLKALQSGDEVVTSGGIFGTITNVKEDRFVLRISDNTKIEIGKSYISSVVRRPGAEDKKA